MTDIKGTLDLGDYGKASDNVLTWVLPALQTAAIEPPVTIIDLTQSPAPDPKVRTFATLSAGNTGVPFALSGKFNDVAQAVDRFLPGGWTGSGVGTFSLATGRVHVSAPVNNFQFSLDGTATVSCAQPGAEESGCSVTVNGLTFGFQVPHQPPVVTDTYVVDPSIATATIDANRFDTHIAGVSAGRSSLESHVDLSALKMGTKADLNGLVIVTNTQQVVVEKRILGSTFGLIPGAQAQFEILVANPTDTQMDDVIGDRHAAVQQRRGGDAAAGQPRLDSAERRASSGARRRGSGDPGCARKRRGLHGVHDPPVRQSRAARAGGR